MDANHYLRETTQSEDTQSESESYQTTDAPTLEHVSHENYLTNEGSNMGDSEESSQEGVPNNTFISVYDTDLTMRPSEHSYLPGTTHPICPRELIEQRRHRRRISPINIITNSQSQNTQQSFTPINRNTMKSSSKPRLPPWNAHRKPSPLKILAVLELDHVILFPGSTLPLRLRDPKWKEYLGTRIQRATDMISTYQSDQMDFDKIGNGEDDEEALTGQITIGILNKVEDLSASLESKDAHIGKVGTLVVITALHEDTENETRTLERENIENDNEPLVVTAYGM